MPTWQASFIFLAIYVPSIVVFVVGGAFVWSIAAGYMFGIVLATTICFVGMVIGSAIQFMAGRYIFGFWVTNYIQHRYPIALAVNLAITKNGWNIIFLIGFPFVIPYIIKNIAPSLSEVNGWVFILARSPSILYNAIVYAIIGSTVESLFDALKNGELAIFEQHKIFLLIMLSVMAVCAPAIAILTRRAIKRELTLLKENNDNSELIKN